MTSRHPRGGERGDVGAGAPRRVVALAAAALVALAAVLASATAPSDAAAGAPRVALTAHPAQSPQEGTGEDDDTGADEDPALLRLEQQTAFVDPNGVFEMVLGGDDVPAGSRLRVTVHSSVASIGRIRFEDTIGGRSLGSPVLSLADIDTDAAKAFAGGSIGVRIPVVDAAPAPDGGLVISDAGVHPVSVSLSDASGAPLDSFVTYLIRLPDPPADGAGVDEDPPLAFAAVLPVAAPPALGADQRWTVAPDDLERLDGLLSAVAEAPELPLTLLALPETTAALAEIEDGQGALDDLRDAARGNEVVASTWVPLDVGAWAAADMGPELADELAAGSAALAATTGVEPTLGTAIIDRTVDPDGLTLLNDVGTTRVVVPEDLLAPLDTDRFPVTLTRPFEVLDGRGRPVAAVAADAGLGARTEVTDDPVLAAHLVLADLSVLSLDREGVQRGATLLFDDDPPPELVTTLLAGLAEPHDTPLVTPVTLDGLFDGVPPASAAGSSSEGGAPLVRDWAHDAPRSLGRYPEERADAQQGLDGYRSLVGDDSPRWPPLAELVQSSGDRRISAAERTDLLTTVAGLIGEDSAAVSIPDGQAITLTAETGTLPIVVDNGADVPMTVALTLRSDRIEFPDGDVVVTTLRPGSNRIELRVRARASGAFPLDVELTSPDGVIDLDDARVTVRSTSISGLGLVLSIGAGVFLAVWWARHFRTTRRARRLVSPHHPASPPTA